MIFTHTTLVLLFIFCCFLSGNTEGKYKCMQLPTRDKNQA